MASPMQPLFQWDQWIADYPQEVRQAFLYERDAEW